MNSVIVPCMKRLTTTLCLTIAVLLSGCITPSTENYIGPSGQSTHETKCNVSKSKCFQAASNQCNGPYEVVSSDSHAGGLFADWFPGPVTWYTMSYQCGQSPGRQPRFNREGPEWVPSAPPMRATCKYNDFTKTTVCTSN